MLKKNKTQEILDAVKMFKTESNKKIELSYLRFLTGNYKTKLHFTNSTSTDGSNVYICVDHPYITNPKDNALDKTFEELNFDKKHLDNKFTLLKLFCRGGLVHEAGHILFNDFELLKKAKEEYSRKKYKYFHELMNIVLDANMELSMINYYEGVREYLEFSNCLAYHNLDTVEEYEAKSSSLLSTYYYWAMFYTIMGREKGQVENPEILKCIEETKPLLTKARYERNMWTKYQLIKDIFVMLEPLMEQDEQNSSDFDFNLEDFLPENTQIQPSNSSSSVSSEDVEINTDFKTSNNKLPQNQPNSNEEDSEDEQGNGSSKGNESDKQEDDSSNSQNTSSQNVNNSEEDNNNSQKSSSSGNSNKQSSKNNESNSNEDDNANGNSSQSQEDVENEKQKNNELMESLGNDLEKVKREEQKREKQENADKQEESKFKSNLNTSNYGSMHTHISIIDRKVQDTNSYDVNTYDSIYEEVKPQIKSFTKNLLKLLREQKEDYETKLISGSRLDMRRIYDKKDLIWKAKKDNKEFADLSISVYVDGSQSMCDKVRYVRKALVILHATCVELNIPLTVVEGRATHRKNEVSHKILCNFKNFKKEDTKYNMVKVEADDNTREGISLKWVSDYHNMQSPTSDKLFIVLSDGEPFHAERNGYYTGSEMIKDCKEAYKKVTRNGTVVMPIALGSGVYEYLTDIYPKVINCEEDHFNKLGDILCKQIKKNLYKK